ncbi:MAG: hypothetical protein EHM45_01595 [Desulfobacteraceae bacterium]|nr:MAG: hypothetical protein EHM45_01595 [Desulfobacteraceae bacterium]
MVCKLYADHFSIMNAILIECACRRAESRTEVPLAHHKCSNAVPVMESHYKTRDRFSQEA